MCRWRKSIAQSSRSSLESRTAPGESDALAGPHWSMVQSCTQCFRHTVFSSRASTAPFSSPRAAQNALLVTTRAATSVHAGWREPVASCCERMRGYDRHISDAHSPLAKLAHSACSAPRILDMGITRRDVCASTFAAVTGWRRILPRATKERAGPTRFTPWKPPYRQPLISR